jgi:hypothetical protein
MRIKIGRKSTISGEEAGMRPKVWEEWFAVLDAGRGYDSQKRWLPAAGHRQVGSW